MVHLGFGLATRAGLVTGLSDVYLSCCPAVTSFLRRMIECRRAATKRPEYLYRTASETMLRFASEWNGVELVGPRRAVRADLQLELFTGRVRQHDRRPLRQRFQVPLPDIGGQVSLNSHPERAFAGFKTLRAILVTFNALRISLPRLMPTPLVTPRHSRSAVLETACSPLISQGRDSLTLKSSKADGHNHDHRTVAALDVPPAPLREMGGSLPKTNITRLPAIKR